MSWVIIWTGTKPAAFLFHGQFVPWAVEYENVGGKGTETFTLQNLYDNGVRMYLRRSGRAALAPT